MKVAKWHFLAVAWGCEDSLTTNSHQTHKSSSLELYQCYMSNKPGKTIAQDQPVVCHLILLTCCSIDTLVKLSCINQPRKLDSLRTPTVIIWIKPAT